MTVRSLTLLVKHVRGTTLDFVQGVPDEWLDWAPEGTTNHIWWHAGHALWAQDLLTIQPLSGESRLPLGWEAAYGDQSRPAADASTHPGRAEMVSLLEDQQAHSLSLIEEHAVRLEASDPDERLATGWPLLEGVVHGWHDEARHQGEMYLLFKIQRATRPI